ncbi:MAG TPA: hypothetical protein VNQ74_06905, partial [Burkholderiaceae bacterium]|nr:hypothetical protein [Burkholderiaceae bacterium]
QPIGVAARPAYGLMNLTEEACRSPVDPADPARTRPCTTPIMDLAGTDAEVVFVTCHETTVGSRHTSGKREISLS